MTTVVSEQAGQPANPHRLVLYPQLKPEYGIPYSQTHINRLRKAGKFPQPIKLSAKCVAWKASAIQSWIDALEAASVGV
ncbi:AlpA family transcriptional regulator [Burkholderia sp. AU31624]|uniref:helix-turn-helix transcriptional regulator n=1 Tax=Burkholderia sp. AU31624 TaxID=2879629 RepID=UPI001CF31F9A|nr:AlpA family phage regulatory protein [Burkholderia sp. AU31624]MCA8254822.1 AlpA family transcriptional regulator [Burkholderia sp. AU31624]